MGRIQKIKKLRTEETGKECIQPLQVLSRADYLTAIVLSILTFVVYAFTAAPGITLDDSPDFIMGVLTLGIVHPPGYPLYTVLGHLFSLLPFGEPAFRVNLFSALWGSLCLGVMFLILRILSIERTHAVFATLFLGFTTVFWSKTAVAEVYSFNAFLIACIVFSILSYNRDKKRSQLYLIFLTTGLALSNHYPLVILTGIGLVFLLDRRDLHAGDVFRGLLFLAFGLSPYVYLFIQASNPDLQYNFGQLSDFRMVVDHILRKHYINAHGGTLSDKFVLALTLLKSIITNFAFASLFLTLGIIFSFQQSWKYRYPLLMAALSLPLALILLLTFPSNDPFKSHLLAFSIPTFLFLSAFLALGSQTILNRLVKHTMIQRCLLSIMLITQVASNFSSSTHHNTTLPDIWATELLNSLQPNSIVLLCARAQLPIYYQQLIKGLRQDVTLYDRFSLYTKNNLYHPDLVFQRPDATEYRTRREQQLINNSTRPIYYTCKEPLHEDTISSSSTPFVYRADKRHSEASDFSQFTVSPRLLDSLVNRYPTADYWLDLLSQITFTRLISYYGGHSRGDVDTILDYFKRTKFYSDPEMLLPIANNLYYFKNYELARTFSERAEQLSLEAFSSTDLAVYCNTLARASNYKKALGICIRQEQSAAPCEGNTVITRLLIAGMYKEQGNWPKVAEYSRKILECRPDHNIAQTYLELASQGAK